MRISATVSRRATFVRPLATRLALAVSAMAVVGWAAGAALAAPGQSGAPAGAAAAPPPAPSMSPIRIAVANPSRIFNEMQETKVLQGKMSEEQKRFQSEQQERQKQIEQHKASR